MKTSIIRVCLALVIVGFFFCPHICGQIKMGAIGDSLLDEHFDQDGYGQSLSYSQNAFELMVTSGRIDAGPTDSWGGTRNNGYQYNWALAGATTGSLLASNQHINLANQVASEGITHAVMVVGSNNLFPSLPTYDGSDPLTIGSDYEAIYEGFASSAEIELFANQAVDDVLLAANTLRASGVNLVVATAPEYGIAPYTKTFYTDPVKRGRVDDVYELWNGLAVDRLTNETQVPVADLYGLSKEIFGDHGAENAVFEVGGVELDLLGTGGVDYIDVLQGNSFTPTSDTVDAFTHDGIHPNSALGGVFANVFMTAFNDHYGDSFTLFSEQEILANGGPNLAAMYTEDTLVTSLNGKTYSDFVFAPVPEPSATLILVGGSGLVIFRRRRRSCY